MPLRDRHVATCTPCILLIEKRPHSTIPKHHYIPHAAEESNKNKLRHPLGGTDKYYSGSLQIFKANRFRQSEKCKQGEVRGSFCSDHSRYI